MPRKNGKSALGSIFGLYSLILGVRGAEVYSVAAVPPLVRAPQPTAEQLAPLPAVDAPSRPWPRSASEQDVYTVDYSVPAAAPPRQ